MTNYHLNCRRYRERNDETPSYTGGVSNEYVKRTKERKDRDRGVYASTTDKDKRRDAGLQFCKI